MCLAWFVDYLCVNLCVCALSRECVDERSECMCITAVRSQQAFGRVLSAIVNNVSAEQTFLQDLLGLNSGAPPAASVCDGRQCVGRIALISLFACVRVHVCMCA